MKKQKLVDVTEDAGNISHLFIDDVHISHYSIFHVIQCNFNNYIYVDGDDDNGDDDHDAIT